MMSPRLLLSACTALAAAVAALSCSAKADDVTPDLFDQEWPAISRPHKRVALSSKIRERVEAVVVKEGEAVRKGDTLVRLDARLVETKIAAAETAADFAGRIKQAVARHQHLAREYERLQQVGEGISESRLDRARTEQELAELDVLELRRQEELAKRNTAFQKAHLRDYLITSPIGGVVSNLWVEEGEIVDEAQKLVEVMDAQQVEIHVHLPERNVIAVQRAKDATVTFPAVRRAGPLPAEISFISPYVDSSSGMFLVKLLLKLKPEDRDIKPGLACRLRFRAKGGVGARRTQAPRGAAKDR